MRWSPASKKSNTHPRFKIVTKNNVQYRAVVVSEGGMSYGHRLALHETLGNGLWRHASSDIHWYRAFWHQRMIQANRILKSNGYRDIRIS